MSNIENRRIFYLFFSDNEIKKECLLEGIDASYIILGKWVLGGFGWIASNVITYRFAKRGKIDDLTIQRKHQLVEKLSVAIQTDYETRELITQQFEQNFSHLERKDAYVVFDKHNNLYSSLRSDIESASTSKQELHILLQESAIYIDPVITKELSAYLQANTFSYISDGMGGALINTYARCFFENLLDTKNIATRRLTFSKILGHLRKTIY